MRPGYIPFNRPYIVGPELDNLRRAIENVHLSGAGPFGARCRAWLEKRIGSVAAFLTPSGTAALELAVILAELEPGDEVIMPSFTFSSTANAVVLRGGVPVFVDARADTLNLDEALLERALSPRTRAVLPVHYAGVACAMDEIGAFAHEHGLLVLEDAAQGLLARYKGKALGGIGDAGAVSFHETKNVMCGEGGALLVRREPWVRRAEIVQEEGTDRSSFFRGEVDRYTWVDVGSSFVLSDVNAALLFAQLEAADRILATRLRIWKAYHDAFAGLEASGRARRPIVPTECEHNAHMYYLLLESEDARGRFIADLENAGVQAVFHYVPLHASKAGRRYSRTAGPLAVTDSASARLVRLPLWTAMSDEEVERVVDAVHTALAPARSRRAARGSVG